MHTPEAEQRLNEIYKKDRDVVTEVMAELREASVRYALDLETDERHLRDCMHRAGSFASHYILGMPRLRLVLALFHAEPIFLADTDPVWWKSLTTVAKHLPKLEPALQKKNMRSPKEEEGNKAEYRAGRLAYGRHLGVILKNTHPEPDTASFERSKLPGYTNRWEVERLDLCVGAYDRFRFGFPYEYTARALCKAAHLLLASNHNHTPPKPSNGYRAQSFTHQLEQDRQVAEKLRKRLNDFERFFVPVDEETAAANLGRFMVPYAGATHGLRHEHRRDLYDAALEEIRRPPPKVEEDIAALVVVLGVHDGSSK